MYAVLARRKKRGILVLKGGDEMEEPMGMTNKQFQGFIRLMLRCLEQALETSPDNDSIRQLIDILHDMLEDS